ncbi:hypothetical protein ACFYSC_17050 [Streptosporangium sp. NPDC004379]|uniref:hypothetical protein n=1 Tax=Streptosporangium sp. NPDC004379 TaxID=3366189 RepID=UPI003685629E
MATENMRVNLHMKAKQLACKVQTRKITGSGGEGLVFQFLRFEAEKDMDESVSAADRAAAAEALYEDCRYIYETARQEVTIPRSDGTRQKYAAVRFMQQMKRAHEEGRLIDAVAQTVESRTQGFGHLEAAGRDDLMLESFVLDEGRPYHHLFGDQTVRVAQARMTEYYRRHPRRYGPSSS